MGAVFWIKRFLIVLAGAFALIFLVQLLKGHDLDYALSEAAIWSLVSATIFTGARFRQSRQGKHCAICKDTPEI